MHTHKHTYMYLQAHRSIDFCLQKLRLLKLSLDNRLEEFPHLAEQNGEVPPLMPRSAQLTGTFYLKLLGVEGLLDFATIRAATAFDNDLQPCSPPRTYSASHIVRNFMTLPTPSRRDAAEKVAAASSASSEDDLGYGGSGSGSMTWMRRGSKHGRSKQAALTKQHSLDHIDEPSSKLVVAYNVMQYTALPGVQYIVSRAYRLKKRACNCTPSKIQTVPKNSNIYSEHCSQAS